MPDPDEPAADDPETSDEPVFFGDGPAAGRTATGPSSARFQVLEERLAQERKRRLEAEAARREREEARVEARRKQAAERRQRVLAELKEDIERRKAEKRARELEELERRAEVDDFERFRLERLRSTGTLPGSARAGSAANEADDTEAVEPRRPGRRFSGLEERVQRRLAAEKEREAIRRQAEEEAEQARHRALHERAAARRERVRRSLKADIRRRLEERLDREVKDHEVEQARLEATDDFARFRAERLRQLGKAPPAEPPARADDQPFLGVTPDERRQVRAEAAAEREATDIDEVDPGAK